jgi:hypothetical protein
VTDELKMKPTHTLSVRLLTGEMMQEHYSQIFEEHPLAPGMPGKPMEGVELNEKTLELFKADGTRLVIERDRIIYHATFPYKEKALPEPVKQRLEVAKNMPERRRTH